MSSENSRLIVEAEKLGRLLKPETSLSLPPAADPALCLTVPSWRNSRRAREHPLHSMMSRVGGFPPALARYFIALYTTPDQVVADPFCGKGTALFEAVKLGRHAVGGDIAPDAVVVSRAKCTSVSVADVARYVEGLRIVPGLRTTGVPRAVRVFYSARTLAQILSIRRLLLEDMSSHSRRAVATFACGVMLGILHGHSRLSLSVPCNQAFAMSPNYVTRYVAEHGLRRPRRDVRQCLLDRALELLPAPKHDARAVVVERSAEVFGGYVQRHFGAAHLILSSPPYLSRQTYVKDAWLRLWFLGRDRKEVSRKSMETGNVSTFVEHMEKALAAMHACLASGGRVVLVCGQANVHVGGKKRAVKIGDLVLYAQQKSALRGLAVERVIRDRKLMKRGSYFAVHHGKANGNDGTMHPRYGEDEIIVFRRV